MGTTKQFKETIKEYLDKRAAEDDLFAKSYAKENKSIGGCVNHILNEVKKSGCCGFTDKEVFGMAVHYYDEDNIQDGKPISCDVVVNHHVELSEEEIKEAKAAAIKALQEKAMAEMMAKRARKPEKQEMETLTIMFGEE